MLPKFLTHFDKKKRRTTMSALRTTTASRRNWCATTAKFPLVLLGSLLLILVLQTNSINAEKDFNFNDSQVPLLEPKDEPIIIDHPSSSSSSSNSNSLHQHNHHLHHQQQQHHHHHNNNNNEQDPYAVELSHCRFNDNEIILSLILKNHNWHDIDDSRKAKVLEKLSKFFAIPKEFITTESVTKHELFEMQKEALKKGNNKCHNNNRKLGRVNFIIGCGSSYFEVTQPITKQLSQQVKDGALDNITGEKWGWWVIWRKQYKSRATRNRRQVEGSGDDDEDDDYYDYDEEPEDIITSTSSSHAHRHHHGDETSEITSNLLENTKSKKDQTIKQDKDIKNKLNNKIINNKNKNKHNDDDAITALKQTDPLANDVEEDEIVENEDIEGEVEDLEPSSVDNDKTSTNLQEILNKKGNLDEEIVESVSQLESVITKTIENTKNLEDIPDMVVEQPDEDLLSEVLQPIENIDLTNKDTANMNMNSVYEKSLNALNLPQDILESQATSSTPIINSNSLNTVVNVQENLDSFSDSTTPLSLTSSSNHHKHKNNHLDSSSSSTTTNHHLHNQSHSLPTTNNDVTTIMTTATHTNTHLTSSDILTDITTLLSTNTPIDTSTPSSIIVSSSSSSSSSSSVSSNVLKKTDMTSNTKPIERIHNNSNEIDVEIVAETKRHEDTLTTATTGFTTEQIQTELEKLQQQQQQRQHHHRHYQTNENIEDATNSLEMFKTKATTTLLTTSANLESLYSSSTSSSLATTTTSLDMLAVAMTTPTSSLELLTPISLSSSSPSSSNPLLVLTSEQNFENNINGKKDDTEIDEEDNQDVVSKLSTTTAQTPEESSTVISTEPSTTASTTTTTQATTTPAPPSTTTEATSSTTAFPDYVEPKMENTPPMIKSRLQKLAVTSGKSFKLAVPEDTFYDNEDLSNLRLELTDKEGRELKTNSWLQFNAETKEIYGLPLDDAVSKWQYRLTATDSGNESVTETLEISVQQHRGVRTVNHEINISVKINEKNIHYIDWQMSLINATATTLGDENTNAIVVREIRANPQDPNIATLVYFNETLPTSECPERELNNLVKRLDVSRLSDLVQPTLGIKSLTGQLIGPCFKTTATKPKTPTVNVKNVPPVPRNQVDRVVATVGHLLVYKVPSDTFFDPNDNELTLSLRTKENKELSPRHWLQFDSKNEEFYGVPKSIDAGQEEYLLVATDAGGLTATDALVVQINHAPKKEFSVYFKVFLANRHDQFNADLQRKFVERIANLFGDASTQNIQIRSINTNHDSDGTIVNFYNTTLFKSHNRCPEEEMEAVRNVFLNDHGVRERVKKALGPELNVTNIQLNILGSCSAPTDVTHREFVPTKPDEPLLKSTFSDDYMFTIILPAIIIVSMILIASIIACCLHRRRRKSGKMELGDEEERKSFRTKGIPVIFQDELDEKPEIGNKSPIILKDEKPPLLPPSYNTSNMNGDNDVDEYVPPPAVVVGGREARGKSPATPSYRKPPPYVSP